MTTPMQVNMAFRKADTPKGWRKDSDGWFYRKTHATDAERIKRTRKAHRMFTGEGSDAPIEHGRTYCCEPYEAAYLDGRRETL